MFEALGTDFYKCRDFNNNIPVGIWSQHFKNLLDRNTDCLNEETPGDNENIFNRLISTEEVLCALRRIKNNKAAGPDVIIVELYESLATHGDSRDIPH